MEQEPGFNTERVDNTRSLEQLGEELSEKLRAEMDPELGRDFEVPKQFDDEDAKNIAAEQQAEARELQAALDDIDAQISQSTQQLAALPLTPEQQAILEQINQLIAKRDRTKNSTKQAKLDAQIENTTKQLAALPVTSEQGILLDDILALMDQREKTSVKLQQVYSSKMSR